MADSEYKPLDAHNHEIRILVLDGEEPEPYRRSVGSVLTATLEHVSLIETEPYIALSYCWGDQVSRIDQKYILMRWKNSVHGRYTPATRFTITANLSSALFALWNRKGRNVKSLRVWVDAICINQDDTYERGQQIQRMQQIYSRAAEVVARIGPFGDKLVSRETLDHLSRIRSHGSGGGTSAAAMPPAPSPPSLYELKAYQNFFDEEYWKRSWIIQEITVASKVKILYADLEFSWEEVATVLSMLNSLPDHGGHGSSHQHLGPSHLLKFREHYMDDNKPITLFHALSWTLHTKATDPRDKIFALLGLCYDGFRLVQVPNYKQSLESIIAQMSRLMLSRLRSLELVCLKGISTERNGMPTWAPNWPSLWAGRTTTTQEKSIIENQISFSFNPVLESSTDLAIDVEVVRVGQIIGLASPFGSAPRQTHGPSPARSGKLTEPLILEFSDVRLKQRQSIWTTLTMMLLKQYMDYSDAIDCFSMLWTPYGRGSINNTWVIEWIDDNAQFLIGTRTLTEWSQVSSSTSSLFKFDNIILQTIFESYPPWKAAMLVLELCGRPQLSRESLAPAEEGIEGGNLTSPRESVNQALE
jgi:hypothetical protein